MGTLKIEDLEGLEEGTENDPFYAPTTKSAMEAVSLLRDYYIGILKQKEGVRFKALEEGLLVQLEQPFRGIDIKELNDQIIYPENDKFNLLPERFEIHFVADYSRLPRFFNTLKTQRAIRKFVLVFNGIDPVTAGDIIKENMQYAHDKLILAIWVCCSANSELLIKAQNLKIKDLEEEAKAKDFRIKALEEENKRLNRESNKEQGEPEEKKFQQKSTPTAKNIKKDVKRPAAAVISCVPKFNPSKPPRK